MNTSINFLSQRQKVIAATTVTDRKYLVWMSYVFGAVVIAGIVVFGLDFYLQRSINKVMEEQASVDAQLQTHAQIEGVYLQLVEKVSAIDKLLVGRVEKRETLQYFTSLFLNEDVQINEIGFVSNQLLDLNLVSSNVFSLEKAIDQLESSEVQSRFASLTTTDLSRSEEGRYSLRVTVGLKQSPVVTLPSASPVTTQ